MAVTEAQTADWENHHIEGFARAAIERGEDGYFNAPLISHIGGNLWVGGCRDGVRLDDDFKYVVSLYPWEKYALGPDTKRVEVKMYDAGYVDGDVVNNIATMAHDFMLLGKTLIHCQAGLNRSNLIAAAVLIKDGHTPEYSIDLLREKRSPLALCNWTFEDWLLDGNVEIA